MDKGELFLVATPIGNLSDITKRAEQILASVDVIAAEDTRHSLKLLNSLGIKNTMISFHEHSNKDKFEKLMSILEDGKNVALISDAGTPLISDPGAELIEMAAERDIRVTPIPGACAPISALIVSGLFSGRFIFEGFLPREGIPRKNILQALKDEERTVIILESPYRLKNTLAEFEKVFGSERKAAVCRELTKIHEEIIRGTLGGISAKLAEREIKGEIVIVLGGAVPEIKEITDEEIQDKINEYIRNGQTKKDAVSSTAAFFHVSKNKVYKIMVSE